MWRLFACVLPLAAATATAPPPVVRTHDVLAARGLVWAARTDGLAVIDLADPVRPKSVARLSVKTEVLRLAADGERVALAAGRLGCVLVDAADPAQPRVLGSWNETSSVGDVALRGDLAFLAEGSDGWRAVDFRDPSRPRSLATVSTRARVRRLALSGALLATAEVDGGVRVFDVSTPGSPKERAALAVEDALDVAWVGEGRLLVALGSRGLGMLTMDGSSPALTVLPDSGPAFEIAVDGERAAVSAGAAGVRLFDLEGARPRALAKVALPREFSAGAASLTAGRLYVAADAGAIAVLDVSDPDHPAILAPASHKMSISFPD